MPLTLYHNDMSVCAQKVRLCLAEKDLAYEAEHLDLRAGDQKRPEYLALNPNGYVSTLVAAFRDLEKYRSDVYWRVVQRTFAELYGVPIDSVDIIRNGES